MRHLCKHHFTCTTLWLTKDHQKIAARNEPRGVVHAHKQILMKYSASESAVIYFIILTAIHTAVSIVYIVWYARELNRERQETLCSISAGLMMRIMRCRMLQQKTLWKIYLYNNSFWVVFSCNSHFCAVETQGQAVHWNCFKPESKANLYFFSVARRFFLDEFHLGLFACLVSIPVGAPRLAVLKCTWITFHKPQLAFDLDLKRKTVFQGGLEKGLYCH